MSEHTRPSKESTDFDDLVSLNKAADQVGLSVRFLEKKIKEGVLRKYKMGRRTMLSKREIASLAVLVEK